MTVCSLKTHPLKWVLVLREGARCTKKKATPQSLCSKKSRPLCMLSLPVPTMLSSKIRAMAPFQDVPLPSPVGCDAEGLHTQTGRVAAACCHMAHVPDSSVHHGWKAWTHQGLLTVWATAPGFSGTQGGLLPEATVHCTTGRREQRSQWETHRPFPHWDCTQDTPSAPTLTVHSGKGSPNPGNAPISQLLAEKMTVRLQSA